MLASSSQTRVLRQVVTLRSPTGEAESGSVPDEVYQTCMFFRGDPPTCKCRKGFTVIFFDFASDDEETIQKLQLAARESLSCTKLIVRVTRDATTYGNCRVDGELLSVGSVNPRITTASYNRLFPERLMAVQDSSR